MRIRMITLSAGPSGVRQPGKIYEVSEREGAELIAGRFAMPVQGASAPATLMVPEPEAAMIEPSEDAALPRARGRRRG